jgi:hypothetical protein
MENLLDHRKKKNERLKVTAANSMFALWPGDQLNFSIFIKPTFGFGDRTRLRKRATAEAQRLAARRGRVSTTTSV